MSRKRELATGPNWTDTVTLRHEASALVESTDAAIDARAAELGIDPRRLRAFVNDARRRSVRKA